MKGPTGPQGPWVLGVECGDQHLSVALLRLPEERGASVGSWRLADERAVHRGHRHADAVLTVVSDVLRGAGLTPSDLALLAPGRGPGGFTGVRVGLATTVGLAIGAGVPIWPVSSLASLALHAAGGDAIAVPLIDARKGEVYGGAYRVGVAGDPEPLLAPRVAPCESLLSAVRAAAGADAPLVIFGSGALTYRVASALPPHWHVAAARHHALLAARAWEQAGRDAGAAPAVDATYLRPSDAELGQARKTQGSTG